MYFFYLNVFMCYLCGLEVFLLGLFLLLLIECLCFVVGFFNFWNILLSDLEDEFWDKSFVFLIWCKGKNFLVLMFVLSDWNFVFIDVYFEVKFDGILELLLDWELLVLSKEILVLVMFLIGFVLDVCLFCFFMVVYLLFMVFFFLEYLLVLLFKGFDEFFFVLFLFKFDVIFILIVCLFCMY